MLFSKALAFLKKERELILYGIFGVALIPSNIIAWFFAFAFAFITNKAIVFQSKGWRNRAALREFASFLAVRLFTLALDTVLMVVLVEWLLVDRLLSKIVVNLVVILVNYVVSKFFIFK